MVEPPTLDYCAADEPKRRPGCVAGLLVLAAVFSPPVYYTLVLGCGNLIGPLAPWDLLLAVPVLLAGLGGAAGVTAVVRGVRRRRRGVLWPTVATVGLFVDAAFACRLVWEISASV